MGYVLHDMSQKKALEYAESDFRNAFKRFVLWQRAHVDCALWHGSDEHGWKRLYATPFYPSTLSRPWR
jgi:hypothetical protein